MKLLILFLCLDKQHSIYLFNHSYKCSYEYCEKLNMKEQIVGWKWVFILEQAEILCTISCGGNHLDAEVESVSQQAGKWLIPNGVFWKTVCLPRECTVLDKIFQLKINV